MRIARFSSLLFSTICMRLLTAAVTFTANCNSCHKIFHEILYTQHTHTAHTPPTATPPPIGMRNKGNCCKLSRAPETLKRFPNNNNKVVCVFFFRCCCGSCFRPIIVFIFKFNYQHSLRFFARNANFDCSSAHKA